MSILTSTANISGRATSAPDFEVFYEENYSKVLFYIMKKISNRSDAEDLTGEVFLYCYSHYDAFDPAKSSITTWLYLIVNSRLKNYYRDKKEHIDIGEMENYLFEEADEMDKAVYLEQLREKITVCLDKLPERQREIIVLRYFKELDYSDIADRLGMTAGNVRVVLSRTLDKLEKDFTDFK